MHLRSLTLRNYRVYRQLDLEFPDGLVGIYGPNGAGKSTLIESVRYALYGDARTPKDELRSAGVREDLRVELVFEHEGNTYEVRRRLKGLALTPEAEVYRNGQLVVHSVREANAFISRVLGMDQRAFLASVCAQQKELTAFATMAPNERRKLVLDLLGVSPIERALQQAREQARLRSAEARAARAALPDLDALEQAAAAAAAELAAAERAEAAAAEQEAAAAAALAAARAEAAAAERSARGLEDLRTRVRLARRDADNAREEAARHEARAAEAEALAPRIEAAEAEEAALAAAAEPLEALERARDAHQERERLRQALKEAEEREAASRRTLARAQQEAAEQASRAAARAAAEAELAAAEAELAALREQQAAASGELGAARARLDAASEAHGRAAALDPEAPCPTCGQALGASYEAVRRRHAEALAAARAAHERAAAAYQRAAAAVDAAAARCAQLTRRVRALRDEETRAARAAAAAEAAAAAAAAAGEEVTARRAELAALPDPGFDPAAWERARAAARRLRETAAAVSELRARAAQAAEERQRAKEALARAEEAAERARALQAEADRLHGTDERLAEARARERLASEAAARAHGARQRAAEALAGARRRLGDHERALAEARERHEAVAALEEEAAYLARLTDLLAAFRLHLVSRLGRRLSAEAARLFGELTEHEYQDLVVDPEDYAIRIADAGTEHELARFSGSESDLASLSVRVAVSLVIAEHAGELGLLVLDEVLGSLDRERRGRMLDALTALQGRFRQVLLVTHNDEVKDLLPAAIEVRKGPGRTATARVLA